MNRTIDDSRELQILVGGDTIALEDGIIKMPPEQAKETKQVIDNLIIGAIQEIKVEEDKNIEQKLTKAQIIVLKEYRENRKTKLALERLAANQR